MRGTVDSNIHKQNIQTYLESLEKEEAHIQPGDRCGGQQRGSEISREEGIKRRENFRGLKETLKAAAQEQKRFKRSSRLIHKDVLMPLILCLLRK